MVAYANAMNEAFYNLKEAVSPSHAMPKDFLPEAKTIVTCFVTFDEGVVKSNIEVCDKCLVNVPCSNKMQDLLDSLSVDNKFCHGDFHPLNIMVDYDKYIILDWNASRSGNPLMDVTWSYLTLNSPAIEPIYGQLISNAIAEFSNEYLNYYCQYANIEKGKVLKYLQIVALRRLHDNISCETDISKYENPWLKDIVFSS